MGVSIVIPTYKRVDLLERLLKSIQLQTYQSYEIIVVDDCSPNQEAYTLLVNKYQSIFKEFSYYSNSTNLGAPYSRNFGILKAKYELIALVDDDDEWKPEKLSKQVAVFNENNTQLGIVYTWTDIVQSGNLLIGQYKPEIEGNSIAEILRGCFIPSPSIMVSKEAIVAAGLFDVAFPSCQDWEMWTRIYLKGYKGKVVREFLTIYHKHEMGSIGTSPKAKKGYQMFYRKHKWSILKNLQYEGLIILLKHLYGRIRKI